ncbi:TPA: ead/Ea22-like family protein [Klebsiella pneumoniae]
MTTDINELAQRIKAAAEKATPGEWVYFPKNTSIEYDVGSDESHGSILYVDSGDFTQVQTDRNGEFIALANPANILALVEALEKAQAENTAGVAGMAESYETTISMLRSRIAELESRAVNVENLQESAYRAGLTAGWNLGLANNNDDGFNKCLAAHTAGIKVEAE